MSELSDEKLGEASRALLEAGNIAYNLKQNLSGYEVKEQFAAISERIDRAMPILRAVFAEREASRLHAAEAGWRVADLVWVDRPDTTAGAWSTADCLVGRYSVETIGLAVNVLGPSGFVSYSHASIEAAKAAAQSHYAASISSAILPGGEGAAIHALREAVRIADEAAEEWDKAPSGMRAGKILLALAGHVPGYRKDTDAIHALLSAAPSHHTVGEE